MAKIFDNISLYYSFLKASLKEMLIYRLDCIVGMISQIITQLVEIIFIWIVFQNTDSLAGWNFKQILLLYGVTLISIGTSNFCFESLYDIGPKYIRNGEFDYLVYFENGEPDSYRYCITVEADHIIYHRYTKEDYAEFEF